MPWLSPGYCIAPNYDMFICKIFVRPSCIIWNYVYIVYIVYVLDPFSKRFDHFWLCYEWKHPGFVDLQCHSLMHPSRGDLGEFNWSPVEKTRPQLSGLPWLATDLIHVILFEKGRSLAVPKITEVEKFHWLSWVVMFVCGVDGIATTIINVLI